VPGTSRWILRDFLSADSKYSNVHVRLIIDAANAKIHFRGEEAIADLTSELCVDGRTLSCGLVVDGAEEKNCGVIRGCCDDDFETPLKLAGGYPAWLVGRDGGPRCVVLFGIICAPEHLRIQSLKIWLLKSLESIFRLRRLAKS